MSILDLLEQSLNDGEKGTQRQWGETLGQATIDQQQQLGWPPLEV